MNDSSSLRQVTAKIGEGGMGEVYRATDAKIGCGVVLYESLDSTLRE